MIRQSIQKRILRGPLPTWVLGPPSEGFPSQLSSKHLLHDLTSYDQVRSDALYERRRWRSAMRVPVGPYITLTFENFPLIWVQIQEMLRLEGGGEVQVQDELEAYSPMVPNEEYFVGTLMIEIDQRERRRTELYRLANIDRHVHLRAGQERVATGVALHDGVDRLTPDGKTSCVHFLRFSRSPALESALSNGEAVHLEIDHPNYGHQARLTAETSQALRNSLPQQQRDADS